MRNARRAGLFVLLLAAAIAVAAAGASASQRSAVSGTYTYTSSSFESVRTAGGNTIIELTATVAYTGTFTGTSIVRGKLIAHADGSANFHDVEVFTGTVNGVPGTVTLKLSGSNDSSFNVKAKSTIVSATDGLAGLRGALRLAGTVQIPEGPVGTYSGRIR